MKLIGIHVNKRLASSLICVILLVTSLLLFTKAIAAPPLDDPKPGEVSLNAADDGRQIELKEGQVLVIRLESNPSTGYAWEVEKAQGTILRQTGEVEFEPELHPLGAPGLLGAPAQQILRFEALAAGRTDLRLVYRRPWEKDVKPARTFSIQVQGVGPFTHVKNPTPALRLSAHDEAPTVEPSNLQSPLGLPSAYNWCTAVGCTPVKDQRNCGSCWAFSTVGALESNIRIRDGLEKNLSEQYLLSCNTDGYNCSGGWWAHDYHLNKIPPGEPDAGAVYEADFPYTARDDPCGPAHTHHEKIVSWAFVGPEYGVPSVAAIKQAILDHGPVSVAVCAGDEFQRYSGGVFQINESCSGYVNHAVVLVGWDDNYQGTGIGTWRLRNSWGPNWGEGGYMNIKYGTSNVGYSANYIVYSGGSCQDAYESDDTYTTAKTITANGVAQHHTFHTSSDEDWGQFAVTAGEAYTITTSNLGTNDTILELYNTDGTTKLRDDDCVGLSSCINNWTAPSTGTYFIRVRRNLSGAGGGGVKIYLPLIMKSGGIGNCTGYEYDLAIVDSNPCQDTQVVQNDGFESGRTIWMQSSGPYYIIGQYPHTHNGSWNAWFGWYPNADDRLYQTINVPADISSARLVIYLYVESEDDPNFPYDNFHAELQDTSGGTLESFLSADNTMSSSYWWKGTMEWSDFSSHAGQTRRLFFQGETDGDLITNFFVDDVTLWTYCGGLPAGTSQTTGPSGWTWEKVEAPSGYTPAPYNEEVLGKHKNE